jgi:hypothetical protein
MPAIRFATYQHPPTAVATPVPYPAHRTICLSVEDLMRGDPGAENRNWLRYPNGGSPSRTKADGFTRMMAWCVGTTAEGRRCHHHADLQLADLPDWDWYFIQALEFGRGV